MDKLAEEILEPFYNQNKNGLEEWVNYLDAIKAMQTYHETKLKEELIKYDKWLVSHKWGEVIHTPERCADEYLKQRNK